MESRKQILARSCTPNRTTIAAAEWAKIPTDQAKRNLAIALAQLCLAERGATDHMAFMAPDGTLLANYGYLNK